jgi:hypothetical protein
MHHHVEVFNEALEQIYLSFYDQIKIKVAMNGTLPYENSCVFTADTLRVCRNKHSNNVTRQLEAGIVQPELDVR